MQHGIFFDANFLYIIGELLLLKVIQLSVNQSIAVAVKNAISRQCLKPGICSDGDAEMDGIHHHIAVFLNQRGIIGDRD